ncbi:MAG TPA: hypothetical protein VHZ81_08305 [Galbitalea sp.]|jgi:hypothetical protein|nr:hypothetical protein [Galbitalea sp.]
MNKVTSALHDATHQMPGVPAHGENQPHEHSVPDARDRHSHPRNPERHHQTPQPHRNSSRVLVSWQNWIARQYRGR